MVFWLSNDLLLEYKEHLRNRRGPTTRTDRVLAVPHARPSPT